MFQETPFFLCVVYYRVFKVLKYKNVHISTDLAYFCTVLARDTR
jgi:hypothetical protein